MAAAAAGMLSVHESCPVCTPDVVLVHTPKPINLPGGKPLDFYLFQRGDFVEFTDDGVTMFALRSIGYTLSDKRNWRGLENIGLKYGFQLNEILLHLMML